MPIMAHDQYLFSSILRETRLLIWNTILGFLVQAEQLLVGHLTFCQVFNFDPQQLLLHYGVTAT